MRLLSKTPVSALLLVCCAEAAADERVTIGAFAGAKTIDRELALGTIPGTQPDPPAGSLAFGVRVGYQSTVHLRAEGELSFQPTKGQFSDSDMTLLAWRAHLLYQPFSAQPLRPFVLAGAGFLTLSPARVDLVTQDTDLAAHLGFGLEFDISPSAALRVGMRSELAPAQGAGFVANLALFAGATFYFPNDAGALLDADRDGVFDDVDQCLSQAEDQDGFDDEDGCPDLDNDHDGILDIDDLCPSDAEDTESGEKPDGCPASL